MMIGRFKYVLIALHLPCHEEFLSAYEKRVLNDKLGELLPHFLASIWMKLFFLLAVEIYDDVIESNAKKKNAPLREARE